MTALQALQLQAAGLSAGEPAMAVRVVARRGREIELEGGGLAGLALGCVFLPEPQDLVLAVPAGGRLWVLAVLARESGAPLHLHAAGGLTVETDGALEVIAPRAALRIGELLHEGGRLVARLARLDVVAEAISTIARQVSLHAGSALRRVDHLEQVRAGSLELQAQSSLALSGDSLFLNGATLVRVDSDQVQIG